MNEPNAVIFGAGKVGRGFLAHLLLRSGWQVCFVDTDGELCEHLDGSTYSVVNLSTTIAERLGPVTALAASNSDAVGQAVESADLLLTSIGGDNLAGWANSVSSVIAKRCKLGEIDLILCENHPNPAKLVRQHLPFANLGISQAQVLRSCIEPTPSQVSELGGLTVQVQDHWNVPLDKSALLKPHLVESISGFSPRRNFAIELTRKLYTYNAINAAVCFLGAQDGYHWLADAANDDSISQTAQLVGEESSQALILEYGFDSKEQAGWCARALAKYQDATIRDPIERNARDPIRKLGIDDRILGPLHLCIKHGISHPALSQTLRAALAYREASDPAAVKMAELIEQNGEWPALQVIADGVDVSLKEVLTAGE